MVNPAPEDSSFNNAQKWRAFFWPVHAHELRKFIPIFLILFFISMGGSILRLVKETLVITAHESGVEIIPWIRLWMILPCAFLMASFFTFLSNRFSRTAVLSFLVGLFFLYFLSFAFLLYPARDDLHLHASANVLQSLLPTGFKGLVAMYRYWTFSTFYVMAELWSDLIFTLVFWGFANQVTRVDESNRFYGLFALGINLAGILAGLISAGVSQKNVSFFMGYSEKEHWDQTLVLLILVVIVLGLMAMGILYWMKIFVLTDSSYYDRHSAQQDLNVKGKLSMRDSISCLMQSKYLRSISILVISYHLIMNVMEVIWKHQVRQLYPTPNDYNTFMSQISIIIGLIATASAWIFSGNSIRKFGWTFTALLTPIILLITCLIFFSSFFLKEREDLLFLFFEISPLSLIVFCGAIQNILNRSAKYTIFDVTKEMAFVPLDSESKLKGKSVIDGLCIHLGKSGGSAINQTLLIVFSSINAYIPYVSISIFAIILIWINAVKTLGSKIKL